MRRLITLLTFALFSVTVTAQQMTDSLRVYFRQGYSAFDPNYRNNQKSVDAFISRVKTFQQDSDVFDILRVTFKAGASPEGSHDINSRISAKRGENLTSYLKKYIDFDNEILHVEDVVEDWGKLYDLVEASKMNYRDEVLTLLHSGHEPEKLKKELQQLHSGYVWRYMNQNLFPELRAFDVYIEVGVRNPELESPQIPDAEVTVEDDFAALNDSLMVAKMPMPAPHQDWTRKLRVKTNAVGWVMSMSNAAVEIDITRHISFQLPIYYSAVNYFSRELKFRTFALQPEFRWWFTKPEGLFVGAHFGMAYFNFATKGDWRYQTGYGDRPLWGGGIAAGYRMPIFKRNPHWELEFSLGGGVYDVWYDKFYNEKNGPLEGSYHTTFIGIDHAAVTLSYSFGLGRRRGR